MNASPTYIGRFAPSPTGPLHFGSLVAALASYLTARSQGGRWLVRMEDLDRPREVPGAADEILRGLEAFGLCWDGDVMLQSSRDEAYVAALDSLDQAGLIFPCGCTRKEIIANGQRSTEGSLVYPGTCRNRLPEGRSARTLRVRVPAEQIGIMDRIQGAYSQQLAEDVGDFILKRADGLFAYQLAVVVDDAEQGITDVVRGIDLLSSTPRQVFLQQALGLPTPGYAHFPVAIGQQGQKLGKQTFAKAIVTNDSAKLQTDIMSDALTFLGHPPPEEVRGSAADMLRWGEKNWSDSAIPHVTEVLAAPEYT